MHALVDALRRGYVNFVELLLDYGVTLSKLTLAELDQLYASRDVSQRTRFDRIDMISICVERESIAHRQEKST